jgi:hypothetical protein
MVPFFTSPRKQAKTTNFPIRSRCSALHASSLLLPPGNTTSAPLPSMLRTRLSYSPRFCAMFIAFPLGTNPTTVSGRPQRSARSVWRRVPAWCCARRSRREYCHARAAGDWAKIREKGVVGRWAPGARGVGSLDLDSEFEAVGFTITKVGPKFE